MGPTAPTLGRLPPPFLGTRPLGAVPEGATVGDDPILSSYAHPPGAEPEDAPGLPIGPDEVAAFIVGLGDILARIRGDHWLIEPAETAIIAPPLARELGKPDSSTAAWLAQHGNAALIIFGAAVILVPRAMTEYQVMRYRRRQLELAARGELPDGYAAPVTPEWSPEPGPGEGLPGAGGPGNVNARPTDGEDLAATLRALTRR